MENKSLETRYLYISNYKNIGISYLDDDSNESENTQKLLLNANHSGQNMGGLTMVVGENNVGKSNVAKALSAFSYQKKLNSKEDLPNFIGHEDCAINLSLSYKISKETQGEGGGQYREISNSIKLEDRELSYSFANEACALRICARLKADEILKTQSDAEIHSRVEKIIDKMQNESNIDKLVSAFNELEKESTEIKKTLSKQKMEAVKLKHPNEMKEYQNAVINACEKMIESARNVIEKLAKHNHYKIYQSGATKEIKLLDEMQNYHFNDKLTYYKRIFNLVNVFDKLEDEFKNASQEKLDYDFHRLFNSFNSICKKINTALNDFVNLYNQKEKQNILFNHSITLPQKDIIPKNIMLPKTYVKYATYYHNIDEILKDIKLLKCDIENKPYRHEALPNIVWYDNSENVITDSDLIVDKDNLENSLFFQSLLNVIKKKASSIKTAYEKSEIQPGYLLKMEEDIDNKLDTILAKRFNEIFSKNGGYSFKIKLGEQKISLCIFKNNEVMEISFQSDGFIWFFNLFFFLHRKRLRSGDIVIMDEPAYNLSVPARYDCRKFLKSYGEANGITFLVITHDPYLIDIDHLDELRIVEENKSKKFVNSKGANITNNFAMGNTQSNALQTIKKALGVSSHHVFCPPGSRIIYVEGITDYIYLTGFKISYKKEKGKELKLAFIPINGIGNGHESIIAMLKELDENPIVLVDNDETGKSLRENLKKMEKCSVDIVSIGGNHVYYDRYKNEVKDEIFISDKIKDKFEAFKTIESYFKEDEIKKYNLINGNNKKSIYAIAFKRALLNNENAVSEETKQNFYTLLEGLNEGL